VKPRRWFLPETPDILGMLCSQFAVTVQGMEALVRWSEGDSSGGDEVRAFEHEADDHKRTLRRALRTAFTTPLDPEDIYALSERLDAVLNGAKNAVRESEVMALAPDAAVSEMARLLADGVRHLSESVSALDGRDDGATEAADAAVRTQRNLERVYRKAMSSLLEETDLREVMGRRELYRRFSRLGDGIVEVAERIWYSVVKEN